MCRSLLAETSHVVLDEIHERDTLSDFLMIVIRDLLQKRHGLKVVLMSATLNAEEFAAYFGKTSTCFILYRVHTDPGKSSKSMEFKI